MYHYSMNFSIPTYMPTLERLKMGGRGLNNFVSEGRKMVHSAAFWI